MVEKKTEISPLPEETESNDGTYVLSESDGDIYLTVLPPLDPKGRPVRAIVVINELRTRFGKKMDDHHEINVTIQSAAGIPIKIYDRGKMEAPPEVSLQISPDRTIAQLAVSLPRHGRSLIMEDISDVLRRSGITFGLDQDAIKRLVDRQMGGELICARGIKPVKGQDAYIKTFVDISNKGRPTELDDGRVDYRDLNVYTLVEKGQLLAERIPATIGVDGVDVFGHKIPAPNGREVGIPVGKNVIVNGNDKLEAAVDGHYVLDAGLINVFPIIEIRGDVDFSTGNVEFSGSVVVRGSVNTGFSVKAEGSVDIFGNVIGGTVEGQTITVRAGIQGRSVVRATRQVIAKFIENSTVSGVEIIVNDVILHSQVIAERRIMVAGRRGIIAGGQVVAGEEIRALVLGTTSGVHTKVIVGQNPEMREEYHQLMKNIHQMETMQVENEKSLTLLNGMDMRTMSREKQELRNKLSASQYYHQQQLKEMRERVHAIEMAFEGMSGATVKAMKTAYPGVSVTIGNLIEPIRDEMKATHFFVDNGVMKMEPVSNKTAAKVAGSLKA